MNILCRVLDRILKSIASSELKSCIFALRRLVDEFFIILQTNLCFHDVQNKVRFRIQANPW